ncbi:hypothetical protein ACFQH6_11700 [Halobacteriaceae archaeon GCM10025711]
MSSRQPTDRSNATGVRWLLTAVRNDIDRLHTAWMGLVFPRQGASAHAVLGRWKPTTTLGRTKYRAWALLGLVAVLVGYPLAVLGFMTRYYARRVGRTALGIGFLGVVLVSVLGWGGLTAAVYLRDFSVEGVVTVAAAGSVATVSAVLAMAFSRIGGRPVTVLFAYPFGVTALFLPPVVAALYSPSLAEFVFPTSDLLAIWLLDNVLTVAGIETMLRARFDLVGLAYVGMWFGIAVPVGWLLGFLVALADLVRPRPAESPETA